MLKINVTISGEVEKFILSVSKLYNKSKESVVCDLVAKGYDPEGKVTGEDISKAEEPMHHGGFAPKDKPARSA